MSAPAQFTSSGPCCKPQVWVSHHSCELKKVTSWKLHIHKASCVSGQSWPCQTKQQEIWVKPAVLCQESYPQISSFLISQHLPELMPHQHKHISVELLSFLADQHYLTRKKIKINTPLPPFTPRKCFMDPHSWNQLGFLPLRHPAWSQRDPTSLIKCINILKTKIRLPPHSTFFLFAGINRYMTYLKSLCDAFWPTGLHFRFLLQTSLLISCLFHFRLGQLLLF